jgi:DNA invertase Pin-like site-specific DNA recombinase
LHYYTHWQQVFAIMLIGYARVSTQDQDNAAQIAALKSAGCELIFQEKATGGRWERPELHRLLGQLRKGDVLVVWKLDRLSRSLKDVLTLMEKVQQAGDSANLYSVCGSSWLGARQGIFDWLRNRLLA